MISCYPRRPMRWNVAIGAIARCKATSIVCERKRRSVCALHWTCGVKPKPKGVNKPWRHFIVHGLDNPGSSATVSLFDHATQRPATRADQTVAHPTRPARGVTKDASLLAFLFVPLGLVHRP